MERYNTNFLPNCYTKYGRHIDHHFNGMWSFGTLFSDQSCILIELAYKGYHYHLENYIIIRSINSVSDTTACIKITLQIISR